MPKQALRELPLDAPNPFAEVARSGEPLFLESAKDLKLYPEWGAAMIRAGAEAAAIVRFGPTVNIIFELTDTGKGIALVDQEHLFDAFWLNDHNSALAHTGTGLGLPMPGSPNRAKSAGANFA